MRAWRQRVGEGETEERVEDFLRYWLAFWCNEKVFERFSLLGRMAKRREDGEER